jgi:hypothetical protein
MHLTAVGTAGATLVAAAIVLVWMPGRRPMEHPSRSDSKEQRSVDDRRPRRSP